MKNRLLDYSVEKNIIDKSIYDSVEETINNELMNDNVEENIKYVVLDYRVEKTVRSYFEKLGLIVISTPKLETVLSAIDGHVDIGCFFDGNILMISPDCYEYYIGKLDIKYLESKNIKIQKGKSKLGKKYPKDVYYNLCFTGKYYIGNYDMIDDNLKSYVNQRVEDGYDFININQGYANCSICVVDDKHIITSDRGIYSVVKDVEGLDCLLIDPGYIELFDLDYGFIGGCSGKKYNDNKVYFFGELKKHKNYVEIEKYIRSCNCEIIELEKNFLKDFGGIFFI